MEQNKTDFYMQRIQSKVIRANFYGWKSQMKTKQNLLNTVVRGKAKQGRVDSINYITKQKMIDFNIIIHNNHWITSLTGYC